MAAPNAPCWNCRKRHIRCDKQRPKCGRCNTRDLDCIPVERKAVFRRGSKAVGGSFAVDQTWVNSEPRKWKTNGSQGAEDTSVHGHFPVEPGLDTQNALVSIQDGAPDGHLQGLDAPEFGSSIPPETPGTALDTLVSAAVGIQYASPLSEGSHTSPYGSNHISPPVITPDSAKDYEPLANIEEACLLRYFIEELSPWFDHCDSQSHFRLVVPLRAHTSSTLRNAIFAVSSRHLSRLPKFKSPNGIIFHGQLLPDLTTSSAVEYMLKCIPGLLSFHTVQDPHDQENLMAAAIILRQYEEMEEEMEEGADPAENEHERQRVNFLAITQTIIHSMISSPLARSSLAVAAYWIAIRQEVYYALTRRRAPALTFTPEDWNNATPANMMIMHAGEVTKWCWGDKTIPEYERLKNHQSQLITTYKTHFHPILSKPPDKSKGEIFPTVWYTTDAQVTGVQHLELSRMILIAENPRLMEINVPRTAHLKSESLVRSIVLNLCGIAIDNFSRRMPALVNAVISIMLYGEYFVEEHEREALRGVIDRTKEMHAWPLKRPFERLVGLWGEGEWVGV